MSKLWIAPSLVASLFSPFKEEKYCFNNTSYRTDLPILSPRMEKSADNQALNWRCSPGVPPTQPTGKWSGFSNQVGSCREVRFMMVWFTKLLPCALASGDAGMTNTSGAF